MTPDRLTDERLDALEAICVVGRHTDFPVLESDEAALILRAAPALIAEVRALRRVAEAAERDVTDAKAQCGYYADVPRCYGPQYKRYCTDCPYEVVRETDMALADWRRVSGREIEERER